MSGSVNREFSAVELEILKGLANGMQTKELALALRRSPATVEHYVRILSAKTGARSRAQLVAAALGVGVLRMARCEERSEAG
ncbi:MAG TPA: helix-turn-helix transcriptional regulator [Candidatus Elarobacter sp.]|nr:helix-turn-helix transcriptional regulator [Candidatus Elarobacter sp.]